MGRIVSELLIYRRNINNSVTSYRSMYVDHFTLSRYIITTRKNLSVKQLLSVLYSNFYASIRYNEYFTGNLHLYDFYYCNFYILLSIIVDVIISYEDGHINRLKGFRNTFIIVVSPLCYR